MPKKKKAVKKESKEDVKSLLLHLESEYRKANISEKQYKELKEKYQKMLKGDEKAAKTEVVEEEPEETSEENETGDEDKLKEIEEKAENEIKEEAAVKEKKGFFKSIFGKKKEEVAKEIENNVEENQQPIDDPPSDPKKDKKRGKEEEITEITPEVIEKLAQQAKEQSESKPEENEGEEKKSGGFFKSLFGKKKQEPQEKKEDVQIKESEVKDVQPAQTEASPEVVSEPPAKEGKSVGNNYDVELEKIKVMLDTVKETGHVTDETIRSVSEGLGEIRSMVFQADAELKESAIKMEKIEDEISEVKPQEIAKKFRETNENLEKHQLELEMLEKKAADAGEKINKVFEMLRAIGGVENLINVNKDIQTKLEDIKEVMKYIERIGTKTEKIFVDLNKGLQDLVFIKAQQEDFNESLKDIVKNIDALNVKFEGYISKKDLDSFKEDSILIKKQMDEIKKVLPIAELKLPENLINLRKEREDIRLLLESLEEQVARGKISKSDYQSIREANNKKLEKIRADLEKEWKKIGIKITPPGKEEEVPETEIKVEERPKEDTESKPEEAKEEKVEEPEEEAPKEEKKEEKKPKEKVEGKGTKKNGKKSTKKNIENVEAEKVETEETPEMEEKKKVEEIKNKMEDIKETFEKKESIFGEEKKEEIKEPEKEVEKPEEEVKPKVVKEEKKPEEKPKEKEIKKRPHKVVKRIKKVVVKKAKAKKPVKIKREIKKVVSEEKRKSEILKGLKKLH